MYRSFARYMLALFALLSLAACGMAQVPTAQGGEVPTPSASPMPDTNTDASPKIGSDAPLLTIRTRGGFCRYGECWSEKIIRADGSYHTADGTGAQKDGTLDAAQAAELTQLIAATDVAALQAQPFTGTCPIAYDGQELIYTFQTLSGEQTIASCSVAIPENDPLFVFIGGLVDTLNQQ